MKIPFRVVSPFAVALAELLAFLALYLAPEVDRKMLLVPIALGAVAWIAGRRLPNRLLLGGVVVFLAFGAFSGFRAPPDMLGAVVATALVPAHVLLWLAKDARTYRFWRAALAFLEVVLAAIVAPETHMFIIIFCFVVAAAVALSFGFLERNFSERDPDALNRAVRPSFLAAVICLAFLIFLSSLLIFPVLPRSPQSEEAGQSQVGYTEVVSFRTGTLGWAAGNPRTVMWLTRPSGVDWRALVPGGLVRGKVLEKFSGSEWTAVAKPRVPARTPVGGTWPVDIFREPLPTEILPVPYGTVALEGAGRSEEKYESGEWPYYRGQGKAVSYLAIVGKAPVVQNDLPRAIHRALPARGDYSKVRALADSLNRGARSDDQRVERVLSHLRTFNWELGAVASAEAAGPHPIDTFLFDTKRGHCELFATSAALLLRAMGVPTRLAVGFRLGSLAKGDLLAVKNTEAHAWVEAYVGREGWRAIDPTPLLAAEESIWGPLDEAYDYVNAYWQRYIMSYEFDGAYWRTLMRDPAVYAALSLWFALWFSWRWYRRRKAVGVKGPRRLVSELYARLDRAANGGWERSVGEGSSLVREYQNLRFGKELPTRAAVRAFELRARAAIRSAGGARASKSCPRDRELPPAP